MQALASPRDDRDYWYTEVACQASRVDIEALASRLVHQVHRDDDAVGDLQHLQNEVQVALERAGIGDDDDGVWLAEQDEVARDLLVLRGRQQRIGTGQVDDL